MLYALLERIRGKEETLFIVAIKPSSDLKLENMFEVYYEKTLNEILEVGFTAVLDFAVVLLIPCSQCDTTA